MHPSNESRKGGRCSLTPLFARPQAALDEQGTAAAQQICTELSFQVRALNRAPCAAAVREMGADLDGRVARQVGAAAHLLALLLHSLAEQDDNDVLGDPAVLSGAPPRAQETTGRLQEFHGAGVSCCEGCPGAARRLPLLRPHPLMQASAAHWTWILLVLLVLAPDADRKQPTSTTPNIS